MELVCKIIRKSIWVIVLLYSLGCMGQNIYNSETIYYHIDTTQCVDKDARFWKGDTLNKYAGSRDSIGLYFTFKEYDDVPIVTVNDENIIRLIDTCIINALKTNYLQFPDSSGYFVELLIFDKKDDSLTLGIKALPISNYYMGEVLTNWRRNDIMYEWYGRKSKYLRGCFFWNNILCVVDSWGYIDYERASCLFTPTHSTIRLALYYTLIYKLDTTSSWTKFNRYYFFPNCSHDNLTPK